MLVPKNLVGSKAPSELRVKVGHGAGPGKADGLHTTQSWPKKAGYQVSFSLFIMFHRLVDLAFGSCHLRSSFEVIT